VSALDGGLNVTLYIGGYYASREPAIVRTVLGSCIAVCLHDPVAQVGGMNHYMLPEPGRDAVDLARFGSYAVELLIAELQKLNAERRRLVAKVFGGAHVLSVPESGASVPSQNIAFIDELFAEERIAVLARDVGGHSPRSVRFHATTGRAFVRRLPRLVFDGVIALEADAVRQAAKTTALGRANAVELFED